MNRIAYLSALIILLLIILPCFADSGKETVLDRNFFRALVSEPPVSRDDKLEKFIDTIVIGRGPIRTVLERKEYKKNYMIVIESPEARRYGMKVIFQVYLENRDTIELLDENAFFEFKGQMMGYTPLKIRRDEYIIDVVLMDGSTVIE